MTKSFQLHQEEIKHLINLAVNLHKHGISPLEVSLAKPGGVPDEFKLVLIYGLLEWIYANTDFREDVIHLHDRLNSILGTIEVVYDAKGRLAPDVVSLREKNISELKKLLGAGESFQNFIQKSKLSDKYNIYSFVSIL